jgi:uncharacterized RDD family membrane protein YckC
MASRTDERGSGIAGAAGRAALFPARAAARAWRGQFEAAAEDVISTPEVARILDRALAGPLPEELARSLIRHRVLERVLAELAASGELERIVQDGLASPRTLQIADQVLASDEMQHALRTIVSSPEVRTALGQQTAGLADQVVAGVDAAAMRLDDRVERLVHPGAAAGPSPYGGIVTRALALGVDALVVTVGYTAVLGIVALIASLAGGLRPAWLVAALLSVGWAVAAGAYFVLFWSTAERTPGMRLLRVSVRAAAPGPPSIGRSIVRLVGLVLSIIPLFAGFLPILFDHRRRGLADFMAGTTVVYDTDESRAARGLAAPVRPGSGEG